MPVLLKIIIVISILFSALFLMGKLGEYSSIKKLEDLGVPFPKEDINQLFEQEISGQGQSKEFISPDGEIKISYPYDWIEIPSEILKSFIASGNVLEEYNIKHLLLAQKIKMGQLAQLIVSQITIEEPKTFEEIIEDMRKSGLQQNWTIKIIKFKEESEDIFSFEAQYYHPSLNDNNMHSVEKIIFIEPLKFYLIAILGPEKDWDNLFLEADSILNSTLISIP